MWKVSVNAAGAVTGTTDYIVNSAQIVRQTTKNSAGTFIATIDFFYDENNEAYGFNYCIGKSSGFLIQ